MSGETERERWHGTAGGYKTRGCRCPDCTRANAECQRRYMAAHPEQRRKRRERDWRNYVPRSVRP